MRKKETPNPSRVRGRGVEVSETLFYTRIKLIKLPEYFIHFLLTTFDKISEHLFRKSEL